MSAAAPRETAPTAHQAAGPNAVSAWLAAYALGMTYSSRSDQQRLACLRDAAHPHPGGLEAAHLRLKAAEVAEPTSHQQALHLLEQAIAAPTPSAPPLDATPSQGRA
jgi:hypothetical protein